MVLFTHRFCGRGKNIKLLNFHWLNRYSRRFITFVMLASNSMIFNFFMLLKFNFMIFLIF